MDLSLTIRKGLGTIIDQALVSGTNFITGVIIGRVCTKEEFGLYMLGFSIVLFAMNLQSSVILTPYSVFCPRVKDRGLAKLTGSNLIHQTGLSCLSMIILATTVMVLWFTRIGPRGLLGIVSALAVTIGFILFREYSRQISFANLRVSMAFAVDCFVGMVQIGGLLLLAHFRILSAASAFLLLGIVCALGAVGWLVLMNKGFILDLRGSIGEFSRSWSFGKWLFGYSLAYAASTQAYPWLLTTFHGTEATGVLGACMGVVFLSNPFLMGMGNLLTPQTAHAYAHGGVAELRRTVVTGTSIFLVVMVPFCLCLLLYGNVIVGLMYGSKYEGYGIVLSFLALSQLAMALMYPVSYALLALERPDAGFKSYILSLAVTLTLGLYLVKRFGLMGVALSLLAGNIAASSFRWVVYHRQVREVARRTILS